MNLASNKLWRTFWILFITILWNKQQVECSGKSGNEANGKSSGLWGYLANFASTVLMTKAENEVNYGKLLQFERNLQNKFRDIGGALTSNPALVNERSWNPVKFPEASAFSALFVRDIGAHLDTWMDLSESKKLREGSRILSQHILWVRSTGSKASTSYFIYRPSFEAELESSNILPHIKHHTEALETAQNVIGIIQQFPNDQIVFAGLQSGGIIAMLHAWMTAASVPIVYRNLKEFKGELHQVKVFLFDSDCALSESYAPNFPIPSWDVLRFYSGMSGSASPDRCNFESMKPLGLAYSFKPTWAEYLLTSSYAVDRTKFVDYYDKMIVTKPISSDNIDGGIEEAFDENASVAVSEISMSIDGRGTGTGYQSQSSRAGNQLKTAQSPEGSVKNLEEIIKPGIELLKQSMSLSKFFYNNLKEIYRTHQTSYLRRNVNGCALAMQRNLVNSLLGKEKESPIVEKGIRDVSCQVDSYNEKSKVALVLCTLESKDGIKSSVLRFRTHVQNEMESVLAERRISIVENEWEEVSMSGQSFSTSDSYALNGGNPRAGSQQLPSSEVEDFYFDDRTLVTGFQEKSEQWISCLDELFKAVPHLNFITPTGSGSSSSSAIGSSSSPSPPGLSTLSIQLPFSSRTAVCEYSLLTQPKNFYQLFSSSSSMFFSIFADVIETLPIPGICSGILEPPRIPHKNSGNAEAIARILNGYFNSDGTSQISHKNTIVNGLELQESITNLPSNNPYEIFNQPLCNLLAECLTPNAVANLYDCNSHLTLWAGRNHCPEVCKYRPSGLSSATLHLCSRVLNCGEGVFLGFRGCKTFGRERPLSEEFASHSVLNRLSPVAYYSAFHLKNVEGWSSTLKNPFRFALFLSEAAKSNFIDQMTPAVESRSIVEPLKEKPIIPNGDSKKFDSDYEIDDFEVDIVEPVTFDSYSYNQPKQTPNPNFNLQEESDECAIKRRDGEEDEGLVHDDGEKVTEKAVEGEIESEEVSVVPVPVPVPETVPVLPVPGIAVPILPETVESIVPETSVSDFSVLAHSDSSSASVKLNSVLASTSKKGKGKGNGKKN